MKFWENPARAIRKLLGQEAAPSMQSFQLQSEVLARDVTIDIYLPPGYEQMERDLPLALFNDGQDLPRMDFIGILEALYTAEDIPPLVAVGIHTSGERVREYGTARQPDYKGRGDKAGKYTAFVLSELLPFLYRHYRLSDQPIDCAIAGFSLGGLSAFDIGWARPDVFGVIGVFSGSFWWRWSAVRPEDPDADRIMLDIVKNTAQVDENQYFWFQCGTLDEEDDRNNNGVIDAIDDTLDIIRALEEKGFHGDSIRYLEIEGGRHEPATWGEAMPDFLRWAFTMDEETM